MLSLKAGNNSRPASRTFRAAAFAPSAFPSNLSGVAGVSVFGLGGLQIILITKGHTRQFAVLIAPARRAWRVARVDSHAGGVREAHQRRRPTGPGRSRCGTSGVSEVL